MWEVEAKPRPKHGAFTIEALVRPPPPRPSLDPVVVDAQGEPRLNAAVLTRTEGRGTASGRGLIHDLANRPSQPLTNDEFVARANSTWFRSSTAFVAFVLQPSLVSPCYGSDLETRAVLIPLSYTPLTLPPRLSVCGRSAPAHVM